MNNFEKNKLIISTELKKKKEIRDLLIKERMKNLTPTIFSISFSTIIIIMIALVNPEAAILAMVFFGAISGIIAGGTYFDTRKGNQIEKELKLLQEDILKLEIEKINSEFLDIKSLISESETF
jgi:hypothetical protein